MILTCCYKLSLILKPLIYSVAFFMDGPITESLVPESLNGALYDDNNTYIKNMISRLVVQVRRSVAKRKQS